MKNKKSFYSGIISSLAVVRLHNADTIHSEIVALCDLKELLAHAKAEGEIEFAGLGKYEAQQSFAPDVAKLCAKCGTTRQVVGGKYCPICGTPRR
jgi:rubrerythrin